MIAKSHRHSIAHEAIPPRIRRETEVSELKDCEACGGTGDEIRMRSPYPMRKILYEPCPACGGTGRAAISLLPALEIVNWDLETERRP